MDKAKIIDCLTEHFVAIGTLHDSQNLTHDNSSTVYSSVNHFKLDQLFDFYPVTVSEVNKALKSLDSRKQSGPDKLDPHFLKLAADFIAPPLTYLFNLSLSTNEIPSIWKTAYVQPLFKGGDPTVLNNYRPISKLSILSKVLESLVNDQLKEFLSSKNALSEFQSGFRKKHSTSTAIIKVLNDLMVSLDNKNHSAALFIEFI